jgi:intein/homing endonuclease
MKTKPVKLGELRRGDKFVLYPNDDEQEWSYEFIQYTDLKYDKFYTFKNSAGQYFQSYLTPETDVFKVV